MDSPQSAKATKAVPTPMRAVLPTITTEKPLVTTSGIPLLAVTTKIERVEIGWKQPELDASGIPFISGSPLSDPSISMEQVGEIEKDIALILMRENPVVIHHPSHSPTDYGETPKKFADKIIVEQDSDQLQKEYLGYVRYLIGDMTKYDVFSLMYPFSTIRGARFHIEKSEVTYSLNPLLLGSQMETSQGGFGVMLTYDNNANMLWFQGKEIWRYEPYAIANTEKQVEIDRMLELYFKAYIPGAKYYPHTLSPEQCVQYVRGIGRKYNAEYFCQDYSLLYTINRIKGLSHVASAVQLVSRGDLIHDDLHTLLMDLAVTYRRNNK